MVSGKKIVTVFGATGAQGGSVVEAILRDPVLSKEYTVRAITRDTSKPSAKALADKGCELAVADLSSVESVSKAISGSETVFLLTNYWESGSGEIEFAQGKAVIDACKKEGVAHFIASTLPSVKKNSKGKYTKVEHFESKALIEIYARESGLPSTFVQPGFYSGNFKFQPSDDSTYTLFMNGPGSTKIPVVNVKEDYGKYVAGAMRNKDKALGVDIMAATYYSSEEVVKAFTEATGKPAKFQEIPNEVMLKFVGGNEELMENFAMMLDPDCGYFGNLDLGPSQAFLVEKTLPLTEFLAAKDAAAEK